MRAYKRIAQGKTVISALAAITAAGLNEQRFPKLAIASADRQAVRWVPENGRGRFEDDDGTWRSPRARALRQTVTMPGTSYQQPNGRAVVPLIPVHLRPKRGLANYHILWEAEWTRVYPRDPYLLRRIGGDTCLVVAAWELTDVERAVMSSRVVS